MVMEEGRWGAWRWANLDFSEDDNPLFEEPSEFSRDRGVMAELWEELWEESRDRLGLVDGGDKLLSEEVEISAGEGPGSLMESGWRGTGRSKQMDEVGVGERCKGGVRGVFWRVGGGSKGVVFGTPLLALLL